MSEPERLAEKTCELLTAAQLKAICRHRGFNPPSGPKETLASFVTPRLPEPIGVERAMASLEEKWLVILHRIAMFKEVPGLDQLRSLIRPGARSYDVEDRALFREVAENLVNRGVVLLDDRSSSSTWGQSRFARCTYQLAKDHRSALPPFPLPSQSLGSQPEAGDLPAFCAQALQAAVHQASGSAAASPTGLLEQVAALISLEGGRLRYGELRTLDWPSLSQQVRGLWAEGPKGPGKARSGRDSFRAAAHILSHLPPGAGATVADLRAAVARLDVASKPVTEKQLDQLCEDGVAAGLLRRGHDQAPACYAAVPQHDAGADGRLVFTPTKDAIAIDLGRSALAPLLELAALSNVQAVEGSLRLAPDALRLGRAAPRLSAVAALQKVRSASAPFDQAVRRAEEKHGKLILHQGLVVFRIEDLGFRTLLTHRVGSIRPLGGPYLAAPRAVVPKVEELARKEGFALRRAS